MKTFVAFGTLRQEKRETCKGIFKEGDFQLWSGSLIQLDAMRGLLGGWGGTRDGHDGESPPWKEGIKYLSRGTVR